MTRFHFRARVRKAKQKVTEHAQAALSDYPAFDPGDRRRAGMFMCVR